MNQIIKDAKAFLFDLDGTLVDSMWMWHDIDIEFLEKFDIPYPEDLQKNIEGLSFRETAIYFKETFNLPWSLDKIEECWNDMARDKYLNEVFLKRGALSLLKKAYNKGIKMAIATSNSRELVSAVASSQGFDKYIDVIVTSSDVKKGKPEPDVYFKAADLLNVSYDKCVVFEDIIPGIMAGKRAGMKVIAVDDEYSLQCKMEKSEAADAFIHSFEEIVL